MWQVRIERFERIQDLSIRGLPPKVFLYRSVDVGTPPGVAPNIWHSSATTPYNYLLIIQSLTSFQIITLSYSITVNHAQARFHEREFWKYGRELPCQREAMYCVVWSSDFYSLYFTPRDIHLVLIESNQLKLRNRLGCLPTAMAGGIKVLNCVARLNLWK